MYIRVVYSSNILFREWITHIVNVFKGNLTTQVKTTDLSQFIHHLPSISLVLHLYMFNDLSIYIKYQVLSLM